jgi:hypothetical protein
MATKPAIAASPTTQMWLPLTAAPSKTVVGQIVVDAQGTAKKVKVPGPIEADATVWELQQIHFDHELTGVQRDKLKDLRTEADRLQAELSGILAGMETVTIMNLLGIPGIASRSAEELISLVEAENSERQSQYLRSIASSDPEMAAKLNNSNDAKINIALQRAAIYWDVSYTTTITQVMQFPGAFSEDYSTGFLADWIKLTDQILADLGKSQ